MDYSKIRLNNERNSHVTKRLNRLSTWKFFKVIYRENIWRMFGYNFLMLLCLAPIFIVSIMGSFNVSGIEHTLPLYNGIGFSTGAWVGDYNVNEHLAALIRVSNRVTGAWMVLSALLVSLILSGGFAVIRDAFWTGKLSAVGVFKSMWKGIKANILYAFVSTAIIASSIFGIYQLFIYISQILNILWLAIVLPVLLSLIDLFVVMYLLILCSVSVTYKQSVYENMDDAWRLLWLNVLPNLLHLIFALIPIVLYILLGNTIIGQLLLIILLMFGGLYFPLVWQTHMMKTFALFHPIEVKKKKQLKAEAAAVDEQATEQTAEQTDAAAKTDTSAEQRATHKPKSKKPTVKTNARPRKNTTKEQDAAFDEPSDTHETAPVDGDSANQESETAPDEQSEGTND